VAFIGLSLYDYGRYTGPVVPAGYVRLHVATLSTRGASLTLGWLVFLPVTKVLKLLST
jgi:hypothetical protein